MSRRGERRSLRPAPRLRGGLLALLVVLLSCGVVSMHSLGAGHSAMVQALGQDLGPTMFAHPIAGTTPSGGTTVLVSGTSLAASVSYAGQGCETCALQAAHGPDRNGGHSGLAMCMAVLSLLVYVVLRWRGRAVRTVLTLTVAGARAFTHLVRGPPHLRAPSLSELCICRT